MSKKTLCSIALISMMSVTGCTNAIEPSKTEVFIHDGSKQCFSAGASKQQTAKQLLNKGIEVYASTCGKINGMMTISVCGGPTLSINVHTIDANQLKQAEAIGFKPVSTLKEGYTEGCKQRTAKPLEIK